MTANHHNPKIGLQLYTIRDLFAAGPTNSEVEKTFAEVAQIGYQNVELAGLYGKTAVEIKAMLDRCGLKAVSTHEPLDAIESAPEAVAARAHLFGYDLVGVPWLAPEHRTPEGYQAIAMRLRTAQERLAQDGITLMWHNHDFEFHALPNGELPEDLLLGSGIQAELDVYWVCHAGLNPHDTMVKYTGRVPVLHIKDMRSGEKNFAEVGTGVLDLPLYVREASQHGVRYLIVEQDGNWTVSPMESARVSFNNLTRMLAQ
jgi:sugar phosphate isomerase/epimerase